ncbi:glycosyltransferase family 2 protein [bacterium]|nr:glycosyltransferase family 2 protein [bacterium]MBU1025673.1 glycosyltransferase family 2 protein [bacterium]
MNNEPKKEWKAEKLSVIIPCYNEIENIGEVIKAVESVDVGIPKEIIVVDDGSQDGTVKVLKEIHEKRRSGDDLMTIHYSMLNFGKGTAIRIGLKYVTGDIVIIQDADMEYDPKDYPRIIQPIIDGEKDVVYGSRFLGKPRPKGMKFANWLFNRIISSLARILYPGRKLTDEATCYKAFKSEIILSFDLKCERFEFCPEVTAKVLKGPYSFMEVPIFYEGRSIDEGKKIGWWDGVEAIWTLLRYRFKN